MKGMGQRNERGVVRPQPLHSPLSTPHSAPPAFTLVEIVIALTIVAILTAAAIPSFRGLRDEQLAREPVAALVKLAKEARLKAIVEKRPYQIAFTSRGFTASRHFNPYLQLEELDQFVAGTLPGQPRDANDGLVDEPDSDASTGRAATNLPLAPPPPKRDDQWSETYPLPTDTHYSIQFWHDISPTPVEGDYVKLWVFQPSGICQPLTLELIRENARFEVEFGALTADIVRETIDLR